MTVVPSPNPATFPNATRTYATRTLGLIGIGLGVAAGLVQLLAGSTIPQWSGNKTDNAALGLTTVILSLVAAAGLWQLRHNPARWQRIGALLLVIACAGVCFTTVGRLWYLPGPVIITAAMLTFAATPSPVTTAARASNGQAARVGASGWLLYAVAAAVGLGLAVGTLFTVLLGTYASSVAVAAAVALVAGLTLSVGVAPALRRSALAMLAGGLGAGLMAGGVVLGTSALLIAIG